MPRDLRFPGKEISNHLARVHATTYETRCLVAEAGRLRPAGVSKHQWSTLIRK